MALAITASTEVSSGGVPRVRLDVSGAVGTTIYVYRTDPDGSVVTVRQGDPIEGFAPPAGTIYDYEAPFDQAVTYKAVDGSSTATSGAVTASSGGTPWLIHPGLPLNSVPLAVLDWPTWTRPIETGVFQPIGRRLRVAVATRRQSVEGTLTAYTDSPTTRAALEALLDDGSPLLLKGTSRENAGSLWVAVGDVEEKPVEVDLREFAVWTLPLTEVDRPAGAALAPATFGDADGTFASFSALEAACPTFADLNGGAWKV